MTRNLPSFSSIRAFEAAARHLSFKDAAEELHVSHSAVSHQIRNLEEFLRAPLFVRHPNGVLLTQLGRDYLSQLSPVLDRLQSCTEEARGLGLDGPLRVQTTPAFAARWLVPRIAAFNQQYPNIELYISTSLDPPNFTRGQVDVVVQFGTEAADGLTVESFLSSPRAPVASPDLLRHGIPLSEPADLTRYTLLRDMVGDDWATWFALSSAKPVELPRGPRFEHCNLTLAAAEQGQGVALAFLALAESALASGALVRLFDIQTMPRVVYSIVLPTERKSYARIVAFRGWLLDQVGRRSTPCRARSATLKSPWNASSDSTAHSLTARQPAGEPAGAKGAAHCSRRLCQSG